MNRDYFEMPMPVIKSSFATLVERAAAELPSPEYADELFETMKRIEKERGLVVDDLPVADLPPDWYDEAEYIHQVFGYKYSGNFWVAGLTAHQYWKENEIDVLVEYYESELRAACQDSASKDLLAGARKVLEQLGEQKDYVNSFDNTLSIEIASSLDEDRIEQLGFLRDAYKAFYKACARVSGAYIDAALLLSEARRGF